MQSILTVQNIKLLFVLASGLYSLTFLHRYRRQKKQAKNVQTSRQIVLKQLSNMKYDDYNSEKMYQLFKRVEGYEDDDGGDVDADPGNQEAVKSGIEKNDKKVDNKQPAKTQKQKCQAEMDSMMSEFLINKMDNTKTVKQLDREWEQQKQRGNLKSNNSEDLEQQQTQLRIKSCRRNITKLEDAIAIEIGDDESYEFIPPDIQDMEMNDGEPSLEQKIKTKSFMLTNEQMLKASKFSIQFIQNTNTLAKRNKIRKIKQKLKHKKSENEHSKIHRSKISKKKPLLTELKNLQNKTGQKTGHKSKICQISRLSPQKSKKSEQSEQKCCGCNCSGKKKQSNNTMIEEQVRKSSISEPDLENIRKEGLCRIIKTQIRYQYITNSSKQLP